MTLTIKVEKTTLGYRGRIACKMGGRVIWSESAKVHRLNKADAKADAKNLRNWHLQLAEGAA